VAATARAALVKLIGSGLIGGGAGKFKRQFDDWQCGGAQVAAAWALLLRLGVSR
jgi:hypothetical protein